MNAAHKWRWVAVSLFCCLVALPHACTPPTVCEDPVSDMTINPKGSPCSKKCECNNQHYTGDCIVGKCKSVLRDTCGVIGQPQECFDVIHNCRGVQKCKPDYLIAMKWGDCDCSIKPESPREEPHQDAAAPEEPQPREEPFTDRTIEAPAEGECSPGQSRPCYTGPPGTKGVGACQQGKQLCKDGRWQPACKGEVKPFSESCDGKDNDCDGSTDEDFKVGDTCEVGKGVCKESGKLVCKSDGSGTECDAKPGTPARETCDGKDNDCDGNIDNQPGGSRPLEQPCYNGPAGTKGVALCKALPLWCQQGRCSRAAPAVGSRPAGCRCFHRSRCLCHRRSRGLECPVWRRIRYRCHHSCRRVCRSLCTLPCPLRRCRQP